MSSDASAFHGNHPNTPLKALWKVLTDETLSESCNIAMDIIMGPDCGIEKRSTMTEDFCPIGSTPIIIATLANRPDVIEALVQVGANIKFSVAGESAMRLACKNGHVAAAEALARLGAPLDGNGFIDKCNPLHIAAQAGHTAIIKILSIDVNTEDAFGHTPLYMAASNGHANVVKLLLSRGANPESKGSGDTPLHIACQNGHVEVIEALITQGSANWEVHNEYGLAPIHIACQKGFEKAVEALLKLGAPVTTLDSNENYPLLTASMFGHHNVVKVLLTYGADINWLNEKMGWSALHYAAMSGHASVVEMLLAMGADASTKDKKNSLPLLYACKSRHTKVIQALAAESSRK